MLPLIPRGFNRKLQNIVGPTCLIGASLLLLYYNRHHTPRIFSSRQRLGLERISSCLHNVTKAAEKIPLEKVENPISEFLKLPVINHFNYNYSINRIRECENSKTDLLLVVPSAPSNFEKRSYVRDSQRWKYTKTHSNVSLLFFIGKPTNDGRRTIQERIENEARIYNDIIQADFFDLYENIRLKAMSMLKWVTTWCLEATYIIRTDDDVIVNLQELIDVMRKVHKNYTDFIIGDKKVKGEPHFPIRTKGNKYHLSYAEYPESTFPPYVIGGLIGYPVSTVQLLYQAALRLKPIWLDDVFITGMCAARMEIPVLEDPKFKFKHGLPNVRYIQEKLRTKQIPRTHI